VKNKSEVNSVVWLSTRHHGKPNNQLLAPSDTYENFRISIESRFARFFTAGSLHLIFGLGADTMLGANLPIEVIQDSALVRQ